MKKAVITGGNKGIGLKTTELFLEAGYKVIVIARDFTDFPYTNHTYVETISYDLSDVNGIKDLVDTIGFVDVFVNNAGVMNSIPYDSYDVESKEKLMNVNLYTPIEFITHISKFMIANKSGRIISVASVAGQIGHPDIWYGVSKAGIINATKSFAKLFAPHGVTVNAVAPGPTETDMMQVIPEDRKKFMKGLVYSGRFAKPEEVAKVIFWLGNDAPEYINGTCTDVNNGSFPR